MSQETSETIQPTIGTNSSSTEKENVAINESVNVYSWQS
jgi:hypothetical protein